MTSKDPTERMAGARILIVEDGFAVADGLKFMLQTAGCEIAGMAGNVRSALELVTVAQFDVALLDIDLRGEPVTTVAEAIQKLGKPLIFLSGYGDIGILPAHLRSLPRLEKPVDSNELFAALDRILAESRGATS
jgi:DNA-binding NtrC family response regulator